MFVDGGTDHPDQPERRLSGASQPPLATVPGTATHPSLNECDAGHHWTSLAASLYYPTCGALYILILWISLTPLLEL